MKRILLAFGTRPEAIKIAPVFKALKARTDEFETLLCSTGQHVEMLRGIADLFQLNPDYSFQMLRADQTLAEGAGRALIEFQGVIEHARPDWLLCQGDTTTAACAAIAGFYNGVSVGHIEAGLRTYDLREPFPEEGNRRLISPLASLHFAPTAEARANLLAERLPAEQIHLTGNTSIDAVRLVLQMPETDRLRRLQELYEAKAGSHRTILVTGHRRENWGEGLAGLCEGLKRALEQLPDAMAIYPVHLNPKVIDQIHSALGHADRVLLLPPQDYQEFVWLLSRAYVVLTDSGGIQEEAPFLGKPVFVVRNKTERPEGVASGTARLVGTNGAHIAASLLEVFEDAAVYERMARAVSPYGDGFAADKIASVLASESIT